jgi:hypothetical protein
MGATILRARKRELGKIAPVVRGFVMYSKIKFAISPPLIIIMRDKRI